MSTGEVTVKVYTLGGECLQATELDETAAVADLKRQLQPQLQVPRFRQKLLLDQEILLDDTPLKRLSQPICLTLIQLQYSYEHYTSLRNAVISTCAGDLEGLNEVERILALQQCPDPREGATGATPLQLAAQFGKVDLAQLLLDAGASTEPHNGQAASPLRLAAKGGHLSMVQLLCQHGANKEFQGIDRCTPLASAAKTNSIEVARYLCEQGASADEALVVDLQSRHLELATLLCAAGARMPVVRAGTLLRERLYRDRLELATPVILLCTLVAALLLEMHQALATALVTAFGLEVVASILPWLAGTASSMPQPGQATPIISARARGLIGFVEVLAALLWYVEAARGVVLLGACAVAAWLFSTPIVWFTVVLLPCCLPRRGKSTQGRSSKPKAD